MATAEAKGAETEATGVAKVVEGARGDRVLQYKMMIFDAGNVNVDW